MLEDNKLNSILDEVVEVNYSSIDELQNILLTEKAKFYDVTSIVSNELNERNVEDIRVRFSGRKSPLQDLLKSLKNIDPAFRKNAGALINHLKQSIETDLKTFLQNYLIFSENKKIASQIEDISLPVPEMSVGSRHPVMVVMRDLLVPFQRMGFSVIDGPEIDSEFYNFDALNVLRDHPAREMQDTFFLASEWVLRTHTSNVQTHALMERKLPLKIVCPGCVYRNESLLPSS